MRRCGRWPMWWATSKRTAPIPLLNAAPKSAGPSRAGATPLLGARIGRRHEAGTANRARR